MFVDILVSMMTILVLANIGIHLNSVVRTALFLAQSKISRVIALILIPSLVFLFVVANLKMVLYYWGITATRMVEGNISDSLCIEYFHANANVAFMTFLTGVIYIGG